MTPCRNTIRVINCYGQLQNERLAIQPYARPDFYEQLIEVSTASGSLHPYIARHSFVNDKMSRRAVPRNLIKEGKKLTNLVTSVMLLSDLKDLGLPASAGELKIIRRHGLAPSFSAYEEDERGRINDNGRKLRRIVYRWNGRFYGVARR